VAIIMDGNGRWATSRGLPRIAGHRAGVAAVRRTVERAPEIGIGTLTVYAFSADNWRRPPREVHGILSLIAAYLRIETERLRRNGVRLEVIGRRDRLPKFLSRAIDKSEWATRAGHRLHLRVAVDYSSREAIAAAAAELCREATDDARVTGEPSTRLLAQSIARQSPDVDLLIRTGGEKRLSDFLLWESAYAELHFTDRMWPEFTPQDLDAAIEEFGRRERRFGGLAEDDARLTVVASGGGR
jgi:undecaprenyl diphosphate synthase